MSGNLCDEFDVMNDVRTRWRKRKRGDPQINRKPKQPLQDDNDVDDDDENDIDEDLDPPQHHQQPEPDEHHQNPNNKNPPDPARETEVLAGGGVRISDFPVAVRHAVNWPHSSVLAVVAAERAGQRGEGKGQHVSGIALENLSYGQLQALSALPAEGGEDAACVITPPAIMEGRGMVKRFGSSRIHVVPMHADWFSPNSVHRLERQVVPHFFSGKSANHTPEKYMECRNCIVAKYMANPEKRLSVNDCQELVVDIDLDDMTRILRFLDHWGIINYCAAAPNREPQSIGVSLGEDANGELHVPSTALKSIDSLIRFDKPRCRLKAADVYPELACHDPDNSDLDRKIRERLSENRCNYCSQPVPTVYYQSQKEVDVLLCLDCFHEGRFVTGHSSLDFVRVDSTMDYGDLDGESWTDQETLLLLEAMELFNENWSEIAEHVGSKSKAQCIHHFIRLPVDDTPLESIEVPSTPISSNFSNRDDSLRPYSNGISTGSSLQEPDSESRLPFANSGNPVMTLIECCANPPEHGIDALQETLCSELAQFVPTHDRSVAFLASAVGPRVAAACAHASLAALAEDEHLASSGNIGQIDRSESGNRLVGFHLTILRFLVNSLISLLNLENVHGYKGGCANGEITNSSQQREENSGVQGSLSAEKVKAAAKAGLASAATKAKLFADHEEREIQRLSANIINHQLKRLELKLKQFAEVETLLMKECEQVERARQRIASERALMTSSQLGSAGVSRPTGLPGVNPASVSNNSGNNRQQVSVSPSQPFISGYGNNQPMHPHMSLMPQQPMYGLGPRLPLSAIHPSSSASPNIMFNAAANARSAVTHPMLRPVPGTRTGLD
ncbi:hypothetical protein RJ640_006134 [Escallonia rubra]|uniref:SWI/SNF complex subunit SWI3C n=1 Tax=Escallonia rubra TaxID=112253 RepID=A0AA88RT24_9ASTE|nr:hypothetical protein RJ640_006134 [Escallonia rubra]